MRTMSEKITAEDLLNNISEALAEHGQKAKSVSFFGEDNKSSSVAGQIKRIFGRQKPVYHLLGGGRSADVLLWRNKKISASVLTGATIIWVLFEWLNYHFLTLVCFALVLGMLAQFIWTNASGFLNRSSSNVPRLVLPEELFVNIAVSFGAEVNRALCFLQDIACEGNLKHFLLVSLRPIHFQFCMRNMKMKSTPLHPRSSTSFAVTTRSSIPASLARSPRELSRERSMNRSFSTQQCLNHL